MISTPGIYDTHKEAHDNKIFETNIFKNLNAIRGERLYIGSSQNERLLTSFQKNISNKVMNDILKGKKIKWIDLESYAQWKSFKNKSRIKYFSD